MKHLKRFPRLFALVSALALVAVICLGSYTPGGGGTGDVVGPASSADNDVMVFSGTGGKTAKVSTSAAMLGDGSSATVTLTGNVSGTDTTLTFGSAGVTSSGAIESAAGSLASPAIRMGGDTGTGFWRQSANRVAVSISGVENGMFSGGEVRLNGSTQIGWSPGAPSAASADSILLRDGAGTLQQGADAASPVAQTHKGPDGSGTDKTGGSMTFAGGKGTGTGIGGAWVAQTSITNATGSTQQTLSTGIYIYASDVALTESSATGVFTVALPAGKYIGIDVHAVTHADDNTDFTATTDTFNVTAIAKSTTISSNVSALQTSTIGSAASTLTTAWTITDNGDNTFTLKNNAVASLTQARLKTKWQVRICSDAPATITSL